jgi:hypothetical protein
LFSVRVSIFEKELIGQGIYPSHINSISILLLQNVVHQRCQ